MTVELRSFASVLRRMMTDMETAPEIVQPSKYWQDLNRRHSERMASQGVENFKRTLAKDYFTWMRVLPWDTQIRFLLSRLPLSAIASAVVGTFRPFKHEHIPLAEGWALNFLTHLIWQYAEREAPELSKLTEPQYGNPPEIVHNGRLISQDLANSVLEFQSIKPMAKGVICELGGGYGRNAYVIASLANVATYILVDIPPAIGIAQQYLTTVFPDKKHFLHRSFSDFETVRDELQASDFAYLTPHQLALLPSGSVDLFINISSLHEMRLDQINHYLAEIYRLVKPGGHFYLKAWKESHIPFENVIIREGDYALSNWQEVFRRTPAVQTRFFEALLRRPQPDRAE